MEDSGAEFCPYCGAELPSVDVDARGRVCDRCDRPASIQPVVTASVAVVDRDAALLVDEADGADGWTLPTGRVEAGERPREAAARALGGIVGLTASPGDFTFVRDAAVEVADGVPAVALSFAVHRTAVRGTVTAGPEVRNVRFWTPADFEAADGELGPDLAERIGATTLAELVRVARSAIVRGPGRVEDDPGGEATFE